MEERELLGEDLVYPGHPVPIALCIVRAFDTFENALLRKKDSYPSALGSREIPGESLNVYLAVELLEKLRAGYGWELAMSWADLIWGACIEGKAAGARGDCPEGQETNGRDQARRCAPLLRELEAWWKS